MLNESTPNAVAAVEAGRPRTASVAWSVGAEATTQGGRLARPNPRYRRSAERAWGIYGGGKEGVGWFATDEQATDGTTQLLRRPYYRMLWLGMGTHASGGKPRKVDAAQRGLSIFKEDTCSARG
jgi:hypothetical protein